MTEHTNVVFKQVTMNSLTSTSLGSTCNSSNSKMGSVERAEKEGSQLTQHTQQNSVVLNKVRRITNASKRRIKLRSLGDAHRLVAIEAGVPFDSCPISPQFNTRISLGTEMMKSCVQDIPARSSLASVEPSTI